MDTKFSSGAVYTQIHVYTHSSTGEVREGGGDAGEEGVREGAGAGGSVVAAKDPVRPASVRDLKTEGRGGDGGRDGEVLRRVHAAQEAAQDCGEISVCDVRTRVI